MAKRIDGVNTRPPRVLAHTQTDSHARAGMPEHASVSEPQERRVRQWRTTIGDRGAGPANHVHVGGLGALGGHATVGCAFRRGAGLPY